MIRRASEEPTPFSEWALPACDVLVWFPYFVYSCASTCLARERCQLVVNDLSGQENPFHWQEPASGHGHHQPFVAYGIFTVTI